MIKKVNILVITLLFSLIIPFVGAIAAPMTVEEIIAARKAASSAMAQSYKSDNLERFGNPEFIRPDVQDIIRKDRTLISRCHPLSLTPDFECIRYNDRTAEFDGWEDDTDRNMYYDLEIDVGGAVNKGYRAGENRFRAKIFDKNGRPTSKHLQVIETP